MNGACTLLPCPGVLEAVRISCAGFPSKRPYPDFVDHFWMLAPDLLKSDLDDKEISKRIINKAGVSGFQLGETKVGCFALARGLEGGRAGRDSQGGCERGKGRHVSAMLRLVVDVQPRWYEWAEAGLGMTRQQCFAAAIALPALTFQALAVLLLPPCRCSCVLARWPSWTSCAPTT